MVFNQLKRRKYSTIFIHTLKEQFKPGGELAAVVAEAARLAAAEAVRLAAAEAEAVRLAVEAEAAGLKKRDQSN
jgi:CO/xanthine dehydrogenase Mo-binding subunit